MIDVKVEHGKAHIKARGSNKEICYMINKIYNDLRAANPDAGKQFKEMMFAGIAFGAAFMKEEPSGESTVAVIPMKRGGAEDERGTEGEAG